MATPQSDQKCFFQQIAMAKQYQETMHNGRYTCNNSDCITYCTTFSFSNAKRPEHYFKHTQSHNFDCSGRLNLIWTLDEKIKRISHEEIKCEI